MEVNDLSGNASVEDEHRRPPNSPLHLQLGSVDHSNTTMATPPPPAAATSTRTTELSSPPVREPSGILSFLPSPIDLWEKRTPTSLFLLPLVFCIYVILQLPLHYNAKNNVRTVNDLSDSEWKGRAREVDELSVKVRHVKKELGNVNRTQKQTTRAVYELKHRLHYLKVRRAQREVYLKTQQHKNNDNSAVDADGNADGIQQQQNKGVGNDGPLASVSVLQTAAVAIFVGNNGPTTKKED